MTHDHQSHQRGTKVPKYSPHLKNQTTHQFHNGKDLQDLQKSRIGYRTMRSRGQDPAHSTTEWAFIQEVYKLGYYTPYRIVPKEGYKFGVSQSCSIP
jgi:hypothetical protein